MASLENSNNTHCDTQQMAGELWASLSQTTLVRSCDPSGKQHRRNRLMRTRKSGGVGRAVSDDGPYPIYLSFVNNGSSFVIG